MQKLVQKQNTDLGPLKDPEQT
jgi:hypothetical protein